MVGGGFKIKEELGTENIKDFSEIEQKEAIGVDNSNEDREIESQYEKLSQEKEKKYREIYKGLGFSSNETNGKVKEALEGDPDLKEYRTRRSEKLSKNNNVELSKPKDIQEAIGTDKKEEIQSEIVQLKKNKNESLEKIIEAVGKSETVFEASGILARMISLDDRNFWNNISRRTVESVLNDETIKSEVKDRINDMSEIITKENGIKIEELNGKTIIGYIAKVIRLINKKL